MADPNVFELVDALVITVGLLSACIGIYLQFLVDERLPPLYSIGFYITGVAIASISAVPVVTVDPVTRLVTLYVALTVLICVEVAVLYHLYSKYGVRFPAIRFLSTP